MSDSFDKFAEEAKAALGSNLVSLVLYGSHARGDAHKTSDVNLFLVVKDQRPEVLGSLAKLIPGWIKRGAAAPVIFEKAQLDRAFDTFSIEFAEIAAARKVLIGEDPFAGFTPDWESVRRELEREARQKQIQVYRRWLSVGGSSKFYAAILADTVPGYLTLLRCTLLLEKRAAGPTTLEETFSRLGAKEKWFKPDLWRRLRAVAKKHEKVNSSELESLMTEYLEQANLLVRALDGMN
jgi:predicted nucleotidyltransferase